MTFVLKRIVYPYNDGTSKIILIIGRGKSGTFIQLTDAYQYQGYVSYKAWLKAELDKLNISFLELDKSAVICSTLQYPRKPMIIKQFNSWILINYQRPVPNSAYIYYNQTTGLDNIQQELDEVSYTGEIRIANGITEVTIDYSEDALVAAVLTIG